MLFTVGGEFQATNTFKSALISLIDNAQKTIDVAVYNLRDNDVIDALNNAVTRGVTVRVFTDGDNNNAGDPIKNLDANITVKDDGGNVNEMHHKFVVVDVDEADARVWTGSANFTSPSFSSQNNNAVIIKDPTVADIYRDEFERLYVSGESHQNKGTVPNKVILDDGTTVQVYFSPGMNMQNQYAGLIGAATKSFYYAVYTYNSSTISDAMIAQSGLSSFGLFEADQTTNANFTKLDEQQAAGMNVATDVNPFEMHHKFLVLDATTVATGSYNFTSAGDVDNDENAVVIGNNSGIAQKYIQEINRIASQNLENLGSNDPTDTSAATSSGSTSTSTTTSGVTGVVVSGPNPFIPGSGNALTFFSKDAGAIRKIDIFDFAGRLIRTLLPTTTNTTEVSWDGRNIRNAFVSSGNYYYRVESGGQVFVGRFTVVR